MLRAIMLLTTGQRRLLLCLSLVSCGFTGLSLTVQRASTFGVRLDVQTRALFDLRSEQNFPTWFASSMLVTAAAIALCVALLVRTTDRPWRAWIVTAAALAALSIDDTVGLHERLEPLGRHLAGDSLHFAWVVPGALLALGLVLTTVWLHRQLPRPAGSLVVVGVFTFVGAAVGLELVGGAVLDTVGDGRLYILVSHVEELVEMLAAATLLTACGSAVNVRALPSGDLDVIPSTLCPPAAQQRIHPAHGAVPAGRS